MRSVQIDHPPTHLEPGSQSGNRRHVEGQLLLVRGSRAAGLELENLAPAGSGCHQGIERAPPDSLAVVICERHFVPPRPAQTARESLVLGHLPNDQQRGVDQSPRIGNATTVIAVQEALGQVPKRRGVQAPAKGVMFEKAMNERPQPAGVGSIDDRLRQRRRVDR